MYFFFLVLFLSIQFAIEMLIPRDYLFTPKNQNKSFIFKILKKTKNAMNLNKFSIIDLNQSAFLDCSQYYFAFVINFNLDFLLRALKRLQYLIATMAQWFGESPVTREVRVRCPMVAGPMITIHGGSDVMMNMIINLVNMRANPFFNT